MLPFGSEKLFNSNLEKNFDLLFCGNGSSMNYARVDSIYFFFIGVFEADEPGASEKLQVKVNDLETCQKETFDSVECSGLDCHQNFLNYLIVTSND